MQAFLNHPDTRVQWLDLTNYERRYMVLPAKPSNGKEGAQDIRSAEDLAVELAAASDTKLDSECVLRRLPFLTHVFATGVPHLRYQRIATLANKDHLSEVAHHMWQTAG